MLRWEITCSDLCAPSDLGRTNSCIEFSAFSFHPGMEVDLQGRFRMAEKIENREKGF